MAYEFVYNRFFENSIAVKPIWLDICLKYLFSKKVFFKKIRIYRFFANYYISD